MTLGFGKHGKDDIRDVPIDYLNWLLDKSQKVIAIIEFELNRRRNEGGGDSENGPLAGPGEPPVNPAKSQIPNY